VFDESCLSFSSKQRMYSLTICHELCSKHNDGSFLPWLSNKKATPILVLNYCYGVGKNIFTVLLYGF
jgi:hypothetical protein